MPAPGAKPDPAARQHVHSQTSPVKAVFPRLGRAQEKSGGTALTLADAEKIAQQSNPTLRQAEMEVRAAKARQQQAGLYPNPTVGYTADEIRGGSVGGGKQGFFVEQTVVLGGKLGLSKNVQAQEARLAETEAEEQRVRVSSAVKMAFVRVLAAQELLDARNDLAKIEADAVETTRRLLNTGQADETEVLDAEVQAQRTRVSTRMQENTLREEWRSLAAVIGKPEMPIVTVAGDLEKDWPELNEEETVQKIAAASPAAQIAEAALLRQKAVLARERKEPVPDLRLRGGMEYNNEFIDASRHAKGWEGIAEVGVQIPFFNRNQGNVAAAQADIERAEHERRRVELTLRERAASVVDQYANSRLMAGTYRDEILPRARRGYELMVDKYGQMLAAYPRVLDSQRRLYEMQIEYIAALESVWTSGIALQGYLLTDGLESPARPGEMDRPVRETNVPMPERTMAPGLPIGRRP